MNSFHYLRTTEEIKKQVSKIVGQQLADPRIGFVTISRVSLSKDMKFAKIFITILDDTKREDSLFRLNNATGYIRRLLAKKIRLRETPKLQFFWENKTEQ